MNDYYNVCNDDMENERTAIRLHHHTKLERFRQLNFHWVINHVGLINKNKHLSVLEDISPECSCAMPSNKRNISLSPVNV
jgi:hypothetical protein